MEYDFRLGKWLVQPQLNLVSTGNRSETLEPKMMEVLVYLAQRRQDVVSKDRLIHAVWSDSHVGDEVLTSCIHKLRKILEDDTKAPKIIRTVPKRGYRLMAPVSPIEPEPVDPSLRRTVRALAWVCLFLIGFLTVLWVWRQRPDTDHVVLRAKLQMPEGLRFQSNFRRGIAVSPDGLYLAFTAGTRESAGRVEFNELYLRRLDQWSSQRIPGSERALNPAFSPDSQWLAYGTRAAAWPADPDDPPGLTKVSVKGEGASTLCSCSVDFGLAWGPEGIVFSRSENGPLEMIQPDGSDRKEITALDLADFEISHRLPAFLPDGRLLFTAVRSTEPASRVYILSLQTGEREPLLDNAWQARYIPTGHIVFARQGDLFAARFNLDDSAIEGHEVRVVEGVSHSLLTDHGQRETGASQYAISDTGLLAYVPGGVMPEERYSVVSVSRQGEVQTLQIEPKQYSLLRVSRDGKSVLLTSSYPPAKIWLYDKSRKESRLQSFESVDAFGAVLGPGLDEFTFRIKGDQLPEYRKRRLGDGPEVASESLGIPWDAAHKVQGLEWSPDGQRAALVVSPSAALVGDIWIMDAQDGTATPWHPTPGFLEQSPAFSPDGEWLAYTSDHSGRDEVYIRSITGDGQPIPISSGGGSSPVWSRDLRELYFRNPAESAFYAASITERAGGLAVGAPERLFEGRYWATNPIRMYDVGPDGRFYLIQVPEPDQRRKMLDTISPRVVRLVHNWFEELEHLASPPQ